MRASSPATVDDIERVIGGFRPGLLSSHCNKLAAGKQCNCNAAAHSGVGKKHGEGRHASAKRRASRRSVGSIVAHRREPGFNRWLVPPAALAIHLCIGMSYGLSVFWLPLSKAIGGDDARLLQIDERARRLVHHACNWRVSDLW